MALSINYAGEWDICQTLYNNAVCIVQLERYLTDLNCLPPINQLRGNQNKRYYVIMVPAAAVPVGDGQQSGRSAPNAGCGGRRDMSGLSSIADGPCSRR